MDEYTRLAKNAIETFIKTGKNIDVPKNLPEDFYTQKKGAFVTIYKKSDVKEKTLRGCIGTYLPCRESIAKEIIDNAVSCATCDPRFNRVPQYELDQLQYEVSILNSPEHVSSKADLDPKTYGVIVNSPDGRRGLLLPGIEGVDSAEQQIQIACQKAGIDPSEKIELYRFTVEKHK